MMPQDLQRRWPQISSYLDRALDLDESARERWLDELQRSEPEICVTVRSLLGDAARAARMPLLNEIDGFAALAHGNLAGQRLGAYTLDSVLGHGGTGTVWLGHRSDGRYEGRVAVKLLNAALLGRPSEQRFVREGTVLARLRHPHIAQLIDAGVIAGQPYLILEYVDGRQIDRYAQARALGVEACIRLFLDVLAAVAHAHTHLIVHRDLKPSNILVTAEGSVKLLDFGIAALLDPNAVQLTRETGAGLTPAYAAPEQLLGQQVTTATDVYALGLVLYQLLAQRHPFDPASRSVAEMTRATLEQEPPALAQTAGARLSGRLRADLQNIVAKSLRKEPSERYANAEGFARDLRHLLADEPVAARSAGAGYRAAKFMRRHRAGVALAALVTAALAGTSITTTVQMLEAHHQRDRALLEAKRAEYQSRFAYQLMADVGDKGEPVTMQQLLDRGVQVLERNYADDPRFIIDSLVNISGRYMDLGATQAEHAALVKAEQLARQLNDADLIAYVQCSAVETELALGQPVRAAERMQDGLANLARVHAPSLDRRAECALAQARVLWSQGDLAGAIRVASDTARMLEVANSRMAPEYDTAASMLVIMLGQDGRNREALDWNRQLIAAIGRSEGDHTLRMNGALHNQAAMLAEGGDLRGALEVQRKLVQGIVAQQGVQSVPAAMLNKLGFYQVRVEETGEGLTWLDRAVAAAAAHGNQPAEIGALLNRASAQALLGHAPQARADLADAERLARPEPQDNRDALRAIRMVRAQLLLAENPAAALELIDPLLAELDYPRQRTARRLAPLLTLKAQALLALNRRAEALATAGQGLEVAESQAEAADRSAYVGEALMTLARVQRASGDRVSALRSAQRAERALSASLRGDHSETRAAAALAATLSESASPRATPSA
ncbi:MAG TPA: protein kinase [Steroidobacteraceae bacterium]|nr:protein kinase [Steroidobacteraceae bacterium]